MTEISTPPRQRDQSQSTSPWIIAILGAAVSVIAVYPTNFFATSVLRNPAALIVTVPVEEIFKVLGVIYLVLKNPESLRDKNSGAMLGGLAGLTFGIIEMIISGTGLLGLIFSTPLHIICSGLTGLGLVFAASKTRNQGSSDLTVLSSKDTLTFWLTAIALHFIYNILAFMLQGLGVLIGLAAAVFIAYKLYNYLPSDLNVIQVNDPIRLISDSISSSPKKTGEHGRATSTTADHKHAFCVKCGSKLEEGQRFCTKCGAKNS